MQVLPGRTCKWPATLLNTARAIRFRLIIFKLHFLLATKSSLKKAAFVALILAVQHMQLIEAHLSARIKAKENSRCVVLCYRRGLQAIEKLLLELLENSLKERSCFWGKDKSLLRIPYGLRLEG